MRLILAVLLTSGLFCTPALAAGKPTPPPARIVDYGDMRCAFAVRRHGVMDSQIVAWSSGFIQGYVKSGRMADVSGHGPTLRAMEELGNPIILREHIRGYCLKHRNRPILSALMAIIHRPGTAEVKPAPAHPHTGPAQPQTPAK